MFNFADKHVISMNGSSAMRGIEVHKGVKNCWFVGEVGAVGILSELYIQLWAIRKVGGGVVVCIHFLKYFIQVRRVLYYILKVKIKFLSFMVQISMHPVSIQFSEGIYSYGKIHIIKTPYFGAKI